MQYDYVGLAGHATALAQFSGYLDTEGLKAQSAAEAAYIGARNRLAYEILRDTPDSAAAIGRVESDVAVLAEANPGWAETLAYVCDELVDRIRGESGKSLWRRRLQYYAVPLVVGVLACIYFGTWFYNDLDVDRPVTSREGLIQRAAAFDKAVRYSELAASHTTRGGFLKGVLLAPFEPDAQEMAGAQEFIDIALEGYGMLEREGYACGLQRSSQGANLTPPELELVGKVSAYAQGRATKWEKPAPMTLLVPIASAYSCPDKPIEVIKSNPSNH